MPTTPGFEYPPEPPMDCDLIISKFEWPPAQAAVARARTGALVDLGAVWEESGFDFGSAEGPTPSPVLRSQRRL